MANIPPPPPQQNPQITEAIRQTRELQARRLAEDQAAAAEAHMLAKAGAANAQLNLPPGFVFPMPPIPSVGENTSAKGQGRRGPPPPVVAPENYHQIHEQEEQERLAMLRAAGVYPPEESPSQEDSDSSVTMRGNPPPVEPSRQQVRHQARQEAKKSAASRDAHPILRQLRADLGLDNRSTIDVTVADHVWSFTPLTPEMTALAFRIAEIASTVDVEKALIQEYAAVCCSIVAIDHEPVWKVFDLAPEKGDDVTNPMHPKGRLRQRQSLTLLTELMTNMQIHVLAELMKAYDAEVDSSGEIRGYTYYKNDHYKYICLVDGCEFNIHRPKRFDSDNKELPYYCEIHGDALELATPDGVAPLSEITDPLVSSEPKKTRS